MPDPLPWEVPTPAPADSIPAPIQRGLARIELPEPVPASQLGPAAPVNWIWQGYVAKGSATLLTGLPKAGKTCLVSHLLKALCTGGELGTAVCKAKTLVVTEESTSLWIGRRDLLGIDDEASFIVRPFRTKPMLAEWEQFVGWIVGLIARDGYQLIIIDPWACVSPCTDENDAAITIAALMPLYAVTQAGVGVLLLHHPKKSDGGEGTAARGSGALTGWADVIMELRRTTQERSDTRRTLTCYSRFDESPPEVVLQLTPEGYISVGTRADAVRADRVAVISELLPDGPAGLTADEVRQAWPADGLKGIARPGVRTLASDLKSGADSGLWCCLGSGHRGDPLRFFVADSIPASSPSLGARNESGGNGDGHEPTLTLDQQALIGFAEMPQLAGGKRLLTTTRI